MVGVVETDRGTGVHSLAEEVRELGRFRASGCLSPVEETVGSLGVDCLSETGGFLADLAEIIEFADGRGEERMAGRPKIRLRNLVRDVLDGAFLEAQIFPKMEGFSLRRI